IRRMPGSREGGRSGPKRARVLPPRMRLYAFYKSSASYRVRLALAHKGLSYELAAVSLAADEHRAPAHLARNPIGQVPVLEVATSDGRAFIAQSVAILEFLE